MVERFFTTSLEHLLAELNRIEIKLLLEVKKARQQEGDGDRFRGLYIPEGEIDEILNQPRILKGGNGHTGQNELMAKTELALREAADESHRQGVVLRLQELARLFGLSQFEIDVLLVCLLPELELKYQKVYAYLQDDATKKSPTVDLVLRLLCDTFEERLDKLRAFLAQAALMKYELVHLHDDNPSRPTLIPGRFLQIDERIFGYLTGSDEIDNRLAGCARMVRPKNGLPALVFEDDLRMKLMGLTEHFIDRELVCYMYGARGAGKKTTAEAMSFERGRPILEVDLTEIKVLDSDIERTIGLVFREAGLQKSAVFLKDFGPWVEEMKTRAGVSPIIREIEMYPEWVFLTGEKDWQPRGVWRDKEFLSIEIGHPSYESRRRLWQAKAEEKIVMTGEVNLDELADRFVLDAGQIEDVLATARSLAVWRHPGTTRVNASDLFEACRKESREMLSSQTKQIFPRYRWEDIVLPKDQMDELHEICSHVKYRQTVYGEWGFDSKLSLGKGLNVLFAGPSGTGKTMAAEIIANELGLDLYKIDLSAIVSKYIGETEKNLKQVFMEGQASNAILFFDEADALFGKRSEVRDSHDRYANIEIAYLLQRMEEYDGIVILASNLRKNMDEAFTRRMHFIIEFSMPEEPERRQIWKATFPAATPKAEDVDLAFLARQFKISGGNIKNIALNAAFLAANDSGRITMENIIRATRREFQKMGKLCTEDDFADYFRLVKG